MRRSLHGADPRALSGDRLHHALSLGALCRCAVPALAQAARPVPRCHRHHSGAVRSRAGATRGSGARYNGGAKFYSVYDGDTSKPHDLRISHIAYDRVHTSADDSRNLVPAAANAAARARGTDRRSCAALLRRADQPAAIASPSRPTRPKSSRAAWTDAVDAAVLVPNCPVCHQTISLVARHLEANGISTVVMGCAKDIVEHAAVPRFPVQRFSARQFGRQSLTTPARKASRWSWRCACWKQRRVRRPPFNRRCAGARTPPGSATTTMSRMLGAEELARRRREFDAQKEIARGLRRARRKVPPRPAPESGRFPPRSVYVNAAFCRLRPFTLRDRRVGPLLIGSAFDVGSTPGARDKVHLWRGRRDRRRMARPGIASSATSPNKAPGSNSAPLLSSEKSKCGCIRAQGPLFPSPGLSGGATTLSALRSVQDPS